MAVATRRADVVWEGELASGKGSLDLASGAAERLGLSWSARTEHSGGLTSPEELLAAAHAGCFAMALSHTLAQNGASPQRLAVTASCSFDEKQGGGFEVASMDLAVHGRVSGLDATGFEHIAMEAEQACPVSNALRGNVEINLTAQLD